jgi:hypothetical protein
MSTESFNGSFVPEHHTAAPYGVEDLLLSFYDELSNRYSNQLAALAESPAGVGAGEVKALVEQRHQTVVEEKLSRLTILQGLAGAARIEVESVAGGAVEQAGGFTDVEPIEASDDAVVELYKLLKAAADLGAEHMSRHTEESYAVWQAAKAELDAFRRNGYKKITSHGQ